jgi:hypothetical protein
MQTAVVLAGGAALIAALAALGLYHLACVRPELGRMRRALDTHDGLLAGGSGGASDRLAAVEAAQEDSREARDALSARIATLETFAGTDVSRIGFVRYNALHDTGSDLSYALAVLNREGDGVVLSSIYSRTDTRTYGKAVNRYKPAAAASEEELEAIERARAAPTTAV